MLKLPRQCCLWQNHKVLTAAAVCEQAHGELEAATRSVLRKHGLQTPDSFVHKAVQLHETLGVRFGVMVVGPTGTGKSTLLRTLQVIPCSSLALGIHACNVWKRGHYSAAERGESSSGLVVQPDSLTLQPSLSFPCHLFGVTHGMRHESVIAATGGDRVST